MMQQISRRQHGSSGDLDVFGATSYFAGGDFVPDFPGDREPAADRRLIQANNKVTRGAMMQHSFSGPRHVPDDEHHCHHLGLLRGDERHGQLGAVVVAKPSGKSKLAALLSFVVPPSPRASFRKESPPSLPPPATTKLLLAAGDDGPANNKVSSSSSSSSSSRESCVVQHQQGCGGVHELDLGVATGDRRLQGVRVVRGGGRSGGEERWVVRCSAWEEHHERMLDDDAAGSIDPKDEVVEEGDDGNPGGDDWESDCSSDLFDLDLEYIC